MMRNSNKAVALASCEELSARIRGSDVYDAMREALHLVLPQLVPVLLRSMQFAEGDITFNEVLFGVFVYSLHLELLIVMHIRTYSGSN